MKKFLIFIYLLMFLCFEVVDSPVVQGEPHTMKNKNYQNYGTIIIDKINLNRKFYKDGNVDKEISMLSVSKFPDVENSLLVLAGHSGTGIAAFFNYLYKMELGDKVKIIYNQEEFNYKIIDIYKIKKDGNAEIYKFQNKRTLILITCTNNEKDKQTIYVAIEN